MQVRLFTVEEANAVLPEIDRHFERIQRIMADLRELRDHLVDLRIVYGDDVDQDDSDGHDEYEDYHTKFTEREKDLQEAMGHVTAFGCEVKDIENGLIDFHARRGEEIVYLCWRRGEPSIQAWHTQAAGYAGRRPIEEF